ncbi:MAG TPA: hypothetical protein VMT64_01975, partial [Candidatus Binataceae bacterium]|nr:hypothetical protein [Candidatus Binataceae bacterium]
EIAIDDVDAAPLRSGRRVSNTPVLSTSAFPARRTSPLTPPLKMPVLSRDHLMIAAAATAVIMAMVALRPWTHFRAAPAPPQNLATQSMSKPAMLPPTPSVAKSSHESASVPVIKPVAIASHAPAASPATIGEKSAGQVSSFEPTTPKAAATAKVAMTSPLPAKPPAAPKASESVAAPAKVAVVAPAKPVIEARNPAPIASVAPPTTRARAEATPIVNLAAIPAVKPSLPPVEREARTSPNPTREGQPPNASDHDNAEVDVDLLQATLRSEMAQHGYPNMGVSVTDEGDVYLDGTFFDQDDQDRMIAMIRAHRRVRDIYFSGTVWYADAEGTPVPGEAKPTPKAPHKNAQPSEFPITAADPTAPPTPAAQARSGIWPFR